jgi:hypothetical protein
MLRSGKNEVMGILVYQVEGASLAGSGDEREGHTPTGLWLRLPCIGVGLLQRSRNEGAYGGACRQ